MAFFRVTFSLFICPSFTVNTSYRLFGHLKQWIIICIKQLINHKKIIELERWDRSDRLWSRSRYQFLLPRWFYSPSPGLLANYYLYYIDTSLCQAFRRSSSHPWKTKDCQLYLLSDFHAHFSRNFIQRFWISKANKIKIFFSSLILSQKSSLANSGPLK